MRVNQNNVASKVTNKEGKKHSAAIGDVKEIIKLFCTEMSIYDDATIVSEIKRVANN